MTHSVRLIVYGGVPLVSNTGATTDKDEGKSS